MNKDISLPEEIKRKPYSKPQLKALGDLHSLTLGGSPGTGESGGTTRKNKTSSIIQPQIKLPDGTILLNDGRIIPPGQNPEP